MHELQLKTGLNETISTLCDQIQDHAANERGTRLDKLTYWQMTVDHAGDPYPMGNGIYWFAHDRRVQYVGKSTSRSLVERIGGHHSAGTEHYMNTFLKHVYNKDFGPIAPLPQVLPRKVFDTIASYRIGVFRIFQTSTGMEKERRDALSQQVGRLETALRFYLEPRLNAVNSCKIDRHIRLCDLIPEIFHSQFPNEAAQ